MFIRDVLNELCYFAGLNEIFFFLLKFKVNLSKT